MFKVEQCKSYKIVNEQGDFLHSDGTKLPRGEYWPTEEQAQAVLDRHQPKHVWKHGDVFKNHIDAVFMYVTDPDDKTPEIINMAEGKYGTIDHQMNNCAEPEFLFNIKDKL